MAEIDYQNFDLVIRRAGSSYRAQVHSQLGETATYTFTRPFSDLELENFLLRAGYNRRGTRRIDSPEAAAAKEFGGRLFGAVLKPEGQECLRRSLDYASQHDARLRIRLCLTDVPELADLPWEYLYNPSANKFLALSVETPVVRYLELRERVQPLLVTPPLRVLVMISSPNDHPALDVDREWQNLHSALGELEQRGMVALERLEAANLPALQRRLRKGEYHVLHFIGHGGFSRQTEEGVLILEDEAGRGRPVSGQDLGVILHDHRALRMAILNACEGARSDTNDPFAGTAQSLLQQGIPAVIAMQFEITDEAAITFAREFYEAVSDGYPVDAALTEARKVLFSQGAGLEWGTPVLYLRAPDGRIFDVQQRSPADERRARIDAASREAQALVAQQNWDAAIDKWKAVLALEPANQLAAGGLRYAEKQRELARVYGLARQRYAAGRWSEALHALQWIRSSAGSYRDVDALIASAQQQIQAAPRPAPTPVARPTPAPTPAPNPTQTARPVVGGAPERQTAPQPVTPVIPTTPRNTDKGPVAGVGAQAQNVQPTQPLAATGPAVKPSPSPATVGGTAATSGSQAAPVQPVVPVVKRKDPTIALLLELVGVFGLLGLGHIYIGRKIRGFVLMGVFLIYMGWVITSFVEAASTSSDSSGDFSNAGDIGIIACTVLLINLVVPFISGLWANREAARLR